MPIYKLLILNLILLKFLNCFSHIQLFIQEEVGDEDDACVKRVGEVFGLILQKDSDFESGISGHHSGPEKAKEINKLENIPGKTVPEEGKKIPQEIVEKLKDELLAPGEENAGS
jgi:hypothetical protein